MAQIPTSPQSGSFLYSLYGKHLQSEWQLNLPSDVSGPADLRLIKAGGNIDPRLPLQISPGGTRWVELKDGSLFLKWPDCFEFMISSNGSVISGRPLECEDSAVLETLLLGPVISFALLKRGIEQIHATAVVVGNGEAVAFVGDSAFGKSTLAASFVQAGHRLLTDDLLVVKTEGGRVWAHPGPQRIKLFPKTAREVLGVRGRAFRNPLTRKLLIQLAPEQFQRLAVPLRAIYVLNSPASRSSSNITIRKISPRDACIHMLRNNYNTVTVNAVRATEPFALATVIASSVPVKTLSYARDYASLADVRSAVLADAMR